MEGVITGCAGADSEASAEPFPAVPGPEAALDFLEVASPGPVLRASFDKRYVVQSGQTTLTRPPSKIRRVRSGTDESMEVLEEEPNPVHKLQGALAQHLLSPLLCYLQLLLIRGAERDRAPDLRLRALLADNVLGVLIDHLDEQYLEHLQPLLHALPRLVRLHSVPPLSV